MNSALGIYERCETEYQNSRTDPVSVYERCETEYQNSRTDPVSGISIHLPVYFVLRIYPFDPTLSSVDEWKPQVNSRSAIIFRVGSQVPSGSGGGLRRKEQDG
jgi:hypothetical protein